MENKSWPGPLNNDFWGDRFFSQLAPRSYQEFFKTGSLGPSVDLRETDHEFILHADIPGVNQEDLDITVEETGVIMRGETRRDEIRDEKGYHLTERRYGSFYRTIPLPAEVQAEAAVARYKNGVLELRLPKVETVKRRGFKPKIELDEQQIH
jgi:HSP20 family protein